jgi:hypothetical protein
MLILLEMLMQGKHNRGHLLSCEQPRHLAVDEAKGGGPIQLRVRVYRSGECDVSDTMACSGASRGVGIYAEQAIAEGGQQVHHCINQGFGTPRTDEVKYHLV